MKPLSEMKPHHRQVCIGLLAGLTVKEIGRRLYRAGDSIDQRLTAIKREHGLHRDDIVLALCLGRVP